MTFKTQLATLLLLTGTLSLNTAAPNYELTTETLSKNKNQYYGIQGLLGTGNEKSSDKTTLEVSLGFPGLILGDKNKAKWGIDCSNKDNNSCEVTDPTEDTFYYYSKKLTYQKAALYLRLDTNNKLNITEPAVDKVQSRLITGGNSWILNDWGVLGLAPQGAFAKYFSAAYTTSASLLLLFNAKDKTAENEKLAFDFRAFINVNYNDTSVVKVIDVPAKTNYWAGVASLDFISPAFSFKNAAICFNTLDDQIIQVIDVLDRCDAVKKLICAGKIGPDCTKDIADFKKAPKLTLQFGETNFEFLPEEYLFYKSDKVVDCRFGDAESLRVNELCDPTTEFGVGRLFMQKFIPVFKYNFGQNAQLVLLNQFTPPYNPLIPPGYWLWIILGIVLALVVIGAVVAFVMKKKRADDDEHYTNIQAA